MAEIKVGQKYKRTHGYYAGRVAEVVDVDMDYVCYKPGFYDSQGTWSVENFLHDWVPVDSVEDNQLSPSVYQFPNGVEVRHISAHLTSFGGQAVQYIARATRLDGVVKGLPAQDIRKAIEVLTWEAERLEALEKQK